MNKFKKIGLTALASSLLASSAQDLRLRPLVRGSQPLLREGDYSRDQGGQ